MSKDDSKSYKPHHEFKQDVKEALVDLNLTESSELWLLKLPFSNDLLADIDGQELSVKLDKDGTLASFEGASGKAYDFVSFASMEPDETVFVSSATESKIAGKISRRVSVVHYHDPKELEKISTTDAKKALLNSIAATPGNFSRTSASKSSRLKSSLSEFSERSNTKRRPGENKSNRELAGGFNSVASAISSDHSHGGKSNASAISSDHSHGGKSNASAISSDHSHGGKSKRSKHKE
ncbi:uncharacterized protein LOC127076541 [Lathyrus oleraceus]|uniref:Uncharacterized protein n=1 Tax=Pisum sativum TaxID=3888 RepID=A0A9D4XQ21_PEA|nr:uncharacterized protein LOC127076541 [Pisum sativum]XP_050874182.1 uncharacterized protein LOC127076541 [Pisum sativum]KAI5422965.1 hypothetical protein KIW84_046112 [Pisum sativum]